MADRDEKEQRPKGEDANDSDRIERERAKRLAQTPEPKLGEKQTRFG